VKGLEERLTITVPEAGRVLGIGRDAAYAAAERGEIPTLRLGRRLVVPVPKLLALLGADVPDMSEPGSDNPGHATDNASSGGPRDAHPRITAA